MRATEMAERAAQMLLQSGAPLPAAIVYAEIVRRVPDDPRVWAAFGVALARSRGTLVVEPFVRAATRCFVRSLALASEGPMADVARHWLDTLRPLSEFSDAPAMTTDDLDRLVAFLDLAPEIVPSGIDPLVGDDRMSVVMGIGDLGAPRFVPVMAAAIVGRWGDGAARSALKRVGPVLGAPEIRTALATLRASAMGETCEPYLGWVEKEVPPLPPPAVVRGDRSWATEPSRWS